MYEDITFCVRREEDEVSSFAPEIKETEQGCIESLLIDFIVEYIYVVFIWKGFVLLL
jgi:hypothetical protein